jgi:hypothetical protein
VIGLVSRREHSLPFHFIITWRHLTAMPGGKKLDPSLLFHHPPPKKNAPADHRRANPARGPGAPRRRRCPPAAVCRRPRRARRLPTEEAEAV